MSSEPTTAAKTRAVKPTARRVAARPNPTMVAAVAGGGALGSLARYGLTSAVPVAADGFPWTTFWVNVTGSLMLGLVATLVIERWPPTRYVRPFVGIGICGGYTTWSTFMTETALLVRDNRVVLAASYLAASTVSGVAATYAGVWLARWRRAEGTRST